MITIPGQSGTYRHSRRRVTGLLADSGLIAADLALDQRVPFQCRISAPVARHKPAGTAVSDVRRGQRDPGVGRPDLDPRRRRQRDYGPARDRLAAPAICWMPRAAATQNSGTSLTR